MSIKIPDLGDDLQIPNLDDHPDLQTPKALEQLCLVFAVLTDYCRSKALARRWRLEGDTPNAISAEKLCDALHNHLPDNLRW